MILDKVWMFVSSFKGSLWNPFKAIMVELALETSILAGRKISWHQCLSKQRLLMHFKSIAFRIPRYDICQDTLAVHILQHLMEADWKFDISPRVVVVIVIVVVVVAMLAKGGGRFRVRKGSLVLVFLLLLIVRLCVFVTVPGEQHT